MPSSEYDIFSHFSSQYRDRKPGLLAVFENQIQLLLIPHNFGPKKGFQPIVSTQKLYSFQTEKNFAFLRCLLSISSSSLIQLSFRLENDFMLLLNRVILQSYKQIGTYPIQMICRLETFFKIVFFKSLTPHYLIFYDLIVKSCTTAAILCQSVQGWLNYYIRVGSSR